MYKGLSLTPNFCRSLRRTSSLRRFFCARRVALSVFIIQQIGLDLTRSNKHLQQPSTNNHQLKRGLDCARPDKQFQQPTTVNQQPTTKLHLPMRQNNRRQSIKRIMHSTNCFCSHARCPQYTFISVAFTNVVHSVIKT